MKVSNSRIQCYKACRRLYELKYIKDVRLVQKPETLERGLNYHDKIEKLLTTGEVEVDENVKTNAMAKAFAKYVAPKLQAKACEEWFEKPTIDGNHIITGRVDAINEDGKLIEHKTTSSNVDEIYWAGLENDEQVLTYMAVYGVNAILYTVCKTPTIRQKQNETAEEFEQRCVEWYDEDTDTKIGMREIIRTQEQIDEFRKEQEAVIDEMANCKLFYKNPNHCMKWGKMCDYAPICNNFDENQTYVNFIVGGKKDD